MSVCSLGCPRFWWALASSHSSLDPKPFLWFLPPPAPSLPQILAGLVDPPREFLPLFKALDDLAGTANVSAGPQAWVCCSVVCSWGTAG